MKIKVCHITTVHQPFDVRIFHKECVSLARNGYDVYLIARHERDERVDNINILAIPMNNAKGTERIKNFWNTLKRAEKLKAKVYHIHDPELLILGILLKIFTGAKIIYDAHEDPKLHTLYKGWINKYLRFVLAYSIGFIEWSCEKFFDRIIVVLDTHKKRFKTPTIILHNFPIIKKNEFNPSNRIVKNKLIYVGGLRKERAIIEIIEALKLIKDRFPDILLVLIGPFIPGSFEKEVQEIIEKNDLRENVQLTGKISFEEVPNYVSESDIGLALIRPDPNYSNALPTKVFEYMMMKKPFVVSYTPITEKILGGLDCGTVINTIEPKDIANKIISLLKNTELLEDMGNKGYNEVITKFNWQNEETKLIECYNNLV